MSRLALRPALRQPLRRRPEPAPPQFYFAKFNGSSSYIAMAPDDALTGLTAASFTVDLWFRSASVASEATLVSKGVWYAKVMQSGILWLQCSGSANATTYYFTPITTDAWHHLVMYFHQPEGKIYMALDGAWPAPPATAGSGFKADSADKPIVLGASVSAGFYSAILNGDLAWARISAGERFAKTVVFEPPARREPPAVDETTLALWPLDDNAVEVAQGVPGSAASGVANDVTWVLDEAPVA